MLTSLKAILRGAARSLGVERAVNAALIEEMWADVVGPAAAGRSRILGVRGTIVLAETEAGPWIQELSAQRGRYVAEINRRLGSDAVSDIRFRPSASAFHTPPVDEGGVPRKAGARGEGEARADAVEADEPLLLPEEIAAVERAVGEIRDPEIRDGARRAMLSQLKWRRRQEAEPGSSRRGTSAGGS
jgi:hypothetical protein